MFAVHEVHANLFLCMYLLSSYAQHRLFQPTLHKTAQSSAWQQKSFVEVLTQTLYKSPYTSPTPSNKCLDVDAHISVSTCWISEPREGVGTVWGPSLGAWVKCKHLTSHTGEGKGRPCPSAELGAQSCHCPWDLTLQPALTPPGLTHPEALNAAPREESCSFSEPRACLMTQILHCSVCHFILVWTCIFSGCYVVKLHK